MTSQCAFHFMPDSSPLPLLLASASPSSLLLCHFGPTRQPPTAETAPLPHHPRTFYRRRCHWSSPPPPPSESWKPNLDTADVATCTKPLPVRRWRPCGRLALLAPPCATPPVSLPSPRTPLGFCQVPLDSSSQTRHYQLIIVGQATTGCTLHMQHDRSWQCFFDIKIYGRYMDIGVDKELKRC
jgi:hypothetical protein